jgi:hypothetical protein
MNPATYIHLNEMESTACNLACKNCYLTQGEIDIPEMTIEQLLELLDKNTVLTRAYYLNNLERDPNSKLAMTNLMTTMEIQAGSLFSENILVTDSLTAQRLDKDKLTENKFNQLTFSPRSEASALATLAKFRDWNDGTKLSVIHTVGLDSPKTLYELVLDGIKKIELNISKPYSTETYMDYMKLESILRALGEKKGLTIYGDSCLEFVANGKDCKNPEDREWEVTTIENSGKFYSCSYTSNKCVAINK